MPAKTLIKSSTRKNQRPASKKLAPFSPQGRISDAVIAQVQAHLRSMTPAQARQHMIKVGIIDKKGNRLEVPLATQ